MVLMCLLGFFGVVFAVNAVMVRAATSTFGGLETGSSYKAGLEFGRDAAAARSQDALHWQVSGKIARDRAGAAALDLTARDRNGAPLSGLTAAARLVHPADARLDRPIAVKPIAVGDFHGAVAAAAGQWELVIELFRGDQRLFRSSSRVVLR
jgi:nitrogen fixation protein FixH